MKIEERRKKVEIEEEEEEKRRRSRAVLCCLSFKIGLCCLLALGIYRIEEEEREEKV